MNVYSNLIDIHRKGISPARITIERGKIKKIRKTRKSVKSFIMPGLIDSHIHIESSMTTPGSFAMTAVSRGTTGVVSDPHEIANVLGIEGVKFMLEDSKKVPLKFWFGAPSCVPATNFESSGDTINSEGIKELLINPEIKYLAEMMNFPGVIYGDTEVYKKIKIAKECNKPIDGHAPGLKGENLKKYVSAGITTDHECSTLEEAKEKISLGMKILIREGSAAKNLNALKDLIRTDPDKVMLCSDDLHPEMLIKRHLDKIISSLINEGFNVFDVIRSCTINPTEHYNLNAGLLRPGDAADFIIVNDYKTMEVLETWIDGEMVYNRGRVLFNYPGSESINKFNCSELNASNITIKDQGKKIRVIEALDGELITKETIWKPASDSRFVDADIESDILKIVVKDRYNDSPPAIGFIKGFGLKQGAFGSSVAHDSHNIICIGTNDDDIATAINEIVRMKGGLSVVSRGKVNSLQLSIAGIISDQPVNDVANKYEALSELVKSFGCTMSAPFMTLSFMALLVIPDLKISDKGLFDGRSFKPVPLYVD
jgi:adenine deaminase